jgi:hypothetical protein
MFSSQNPNVAHPPTYQDWLDRYMAVRKIPKDGTTPVGKDRVRVSPMIDTIVQVVGEDGPYLLVRNLPPSDPQSRLFGPYMSGEIEQVYAGMRADYVKGKLMVTDAADTYPPFTDKLHFVREDKGLPHQGHWEVSFDIADMNGDGRPDLILPPERLGDRDPLIFFQLPDHSWRQAVATWPRKEIKLDYGSVRVADFDGDGNPDLALACHFGDDYVLYGNGKGDFSRYAVLPKLNPSVTSRTLAVADFNGDGRSDIALFDELDLDLATNQQVKNGLVNVVLNLPGGWKATGDGLPSGIHGDWLTAADLLGTGHPDLLLTSRRQGVTSLLFKNANGGRSWQEFAADAMPINAFVYANAVGVFNKFHRKDLVMCFQQFDPRRAVTPAQACGIYHFFTSTGAFTEKPTFELLYKRAMEYDSFVAVAVGDIDGDGRDDIAFATYNGEIKVFLQLEPGQLFEVHAPELNIGGAQAFDIKIRDLYGDGKGEIVVMGSEGPKHQPGGVWVFRPELTAVTTSRP